MISPTLACADWLNLQQEIAVMDQAGVDSYHIDIMDGHYVPNLCFNLDILAAIRRVSRTPVDVHLMVTDPLDYVDRLAACGAELACTHIDSCPDVGAFLSALEAKGIKKGLVLSPGDGPELLDPWLDRLDYVLLMFVQPGFSGQKFRPEVLAKLAALDALRCQRGLDLMLEADGGIGWDNAAALVENGADLLVSGVFASLDRRGELGERTAVFRAVSAQRHGARFTRHLFKEASV
ncbi:ribulose-phosphate 3-epimerase [Anaerofilum sp. BX8]|uniref:Ribulose-phosphate 3-epimerase n=1 Tax=Anaerofilum hominis TaxID=2763016 RepID=A0A923REP0_9FIRM|nr:ribulose-phosphate 3-epimerase [Anaerofilum hominis]MBC5582405.1 ribulose-phosphate 3-epimerase [Anaerofilum hominis]